MSSSRIMSRGNCTHRGMNLGSVCAMCLFQIICNKPQIKNTWIAFVAAVQNRSWEGNVFGKMCRRFCGLFVWFSFSTKSTTISKGNYKGTAAISLAIPRVNNKHFRLNTRAQNSTHFEVTAAPPLAGAGFVCPWVRLPHVVPGGFINSDMLCSRLSFCSPSHGGLWGLVGYVITYRVEQNARLHCTIVLSWLVSCVLKVNAKT